MFSPELVGPVSLHHPQMSWLRMQGNFTTACPQRWCSRGKRRHEEKDKDVLTGVCGCRPCEWVSVWTHKSYFRHLILSFPLSRPPVSVRPPVERNPGFATLDSLLLMTPRVLPFWSSEYSPWYRQRHIKNCMYRIVPAYIDCNGLSLLSALKLKPNAKNHLSLRARVRLLQIMRVRLLQTKLFFYQDFFSRWRRCLCWKRSSK
jgi:hypothetical protein